MKVLVLIAFVLLLGCGESTPRNTIKFPTERPEKPGNVYYKVPSGIPLPLAEAYSDYQEKLTEKQWGFFLISVKDFCDGEVDWDQLEARVFVRYPQLHETHRRGLGLVYSRLPMFSRTEQGRKEAWEWQRFRRTGETGIHDEKIANDAILSKANLDEKKAPKAFYDEHFKGKIYDCVDGWDMEQ